MKPLTHLIFGVLFAFILLLIFPAIGLIGFLIILLSSVFIDADHYIYYILKKKDWDLKNAYDWFVKKEKEFRKLSIEKRKQFSLPLCFLHTLEFLLIFAVLSVFSNIFLYIFTGFVFHIFLDSILAAHQGYGHQISTIYSLIKSKKLRDIEDIK